MDPRKRPLTQAELEKIARQIEAGEYEDEEEWVAESDESENEDLEETDIVEDDEFDALTPEDLQEEEEGKEDDDRPLSSTSRCLPERRRVVYSKDGHKWYLNSFHAKNTRTAEKNIVLHLPGPRGSARNLTDVRRIWNLFFTDDILDVIVKSTNQQIDVKKRNYKTDQRYIGETNKVELSALFGLLYMTGVLKKAHLTLADIWSATFGPPIFRATMSKNRFEFLVNCLRFDDKTTREERKKEDKFAAIRQIWDVFEGHCKENYTPSEYVTIDETLLGFRGRCPFKMYIPNKPDKYGLKLVTMCDAKTFYMCSAKPYIGKEAREGQYSIPTQYVLYLTENIKGTNRNCTMDNWFSSYEVAEKLLERKLTMVGTMRKNKRVIPKQLLETRGRDVSSSMFVYDERSILVSYVPSKNKTVVLLSTMHTQGDIDDQTKKPEVILFYNHTKGGVDTFDQLCHLTTVSRKTRRWPLRIFYGMVDIAGVNTYVIYKCNVTGDKIPKRSAFLKELAFALVEDRLKERMHNSRLPREMKNTIRVILKCEDEAERPVEKPNLPLGRCDYCPRSKNRKARNRCEHCGKSVCAEHRLSICIDCK